MIFSNITRKNGGWFETKGLQRDIAAQNKRVGLREKKKLIMKNIKSAKMENVAGFKHTHIHTYVVICICIIWKIDLRRKGPKSLFCICLLAESCQK